MDIALDKVCELILRALAQPSRLTLPVDGGIEEVRQIGIQRLQLGLGRLRAGGTGGFGHARYMAAISGGGKASRAIKLAPHYAAWATNER